MTKKSAVMGTCCVHHWDVATESRTDDETGLIAFRGTCRRCGATTNFPLRANVEWQHFRTDVSRRSVVQNTTHSLPAPDPTPGELEENLS